MVGTMITDKNNIFLGSQLLFIKHIVKTHRPFLWSHSKEEAFSQISFEMLYYF